MILVFVLELILIELSLVELILVLVLKLIFKLELILVLVHHGSAAYKGLSGTAARSLSVRRHPAGCELLAGL